VCYEVGRRIVKGGRKKINHKDSTKKVVIHTTYRVFLENGSPNYMCTVGWTDSDDEKSRNRFRDTQLYLFVLNSDEVLFLERETYAKKGERDINDEREEKEGRERFY